MGKGSAYAPMRSLPLTPRPRRRGDTPSGTGTTLRSLRCRLGTGASRTSLLSLCTGGRVKVISYLCRIFRKPTCSRKGGGRRHLHSQPRQDPLGHAISDPMAPTPASLGIPVGRNSLPHSNWPTPQARWLQALPLRTSSPQLCQHTLQHVSQAPSSW